MIAVYKYAAIRILHVFDSWFNYALNFKIILFETIGNKKNWKERTFIWRTCCVIISKAWQHPKILQSMDYFQLVDKKSLRGLEVVEGVDHLQNHRPEKTGQDLDQVGWNVRHIQQLKVLILICRKYDEQNIFVGQFDILLFLCKSNLYFLLTLNGARYIFSWRGI